MLKTLTVIAALAVSTPALATSAGSMSGSSDHFSKNPSCYVNGEFDGPWGSHDSEKLCKARNGVWVQPGGTVVTPIQAPVQTTPRGSNSGSLTASDADECKYLSLANWSCPLNGFPNNPPYPHPRSTTAEGLGAAYFNGLSNSMINVR